MDFSRFWVLHLQLCNRACCSLISRAHEGLWWQGRCDPSWQMVHTLLCRESLKEEGSQSHSAQQSQPHFWLRGFHKVFLEKQEAGGCKGMSCVTLPPPRLDAFATCLMGCAGSTLGFPAASSAPPPGLGRISDSGTLCSQERTVDFSGFAPTERQPGSWNRKGSPAGSTEGCCAVLYNWAVNWEL